VTSCSTYYERELTYLRRLGAEFASATPRRGGGCSWSPAQCDDPHVERLLEGFAFLAARVHLKLDDDFPEISEALLDTVYPEYTRPIPSMSLVQFHLDPSRASCPPASRVPRGDACCTRAPVDGGVPCQFRTCYDTTLWPVRSRRRRGCRRTS
jgi:type VI secretion system protein ImpG